MASRSYVVALPVTITVGPGGQVSYVVDLTDAADLSEVAYEDCQHLKGYEALAAEKVIQRDEEIIQDNVTGYGPFRAVNPPKE